MSTNRSDCEHGHGGEVLQLAEDIGLAHGLEVESAVLVVLGPGGSTPFVIGKFNTTSLVVAADAVLAKGAEHEPDGCAMCDSAAIACDATAQFLRRTFHQNHAARKVQ
jgi:hypothetical protein